MAENEDNSSHGADRVSRPDIATPESTAKQFAAELASIASRVRELAKGEYIEYNGLGLIAGTESGMTLSQHRDSLRLYQINTNEPKDHPYLPGYEYRLDVGGSHTDLETLPIAEEYLKNHPDKNFFSTSYFFSADGKFAKISTIPNDEELQKEELMQKIFGQGRYVSDAYSEELSFRRAGIPMDIGDFEHAGFIIRDVSRKLQQPKETPRDDSLN